MESGTTLEERNAMAQAVRQMLAQEGLPPGGNGVDGADPDLWKKLAEMGVAGLIIPAGFGGMGLGPVELELIAEEFGAVLAGVPFLSTSVLAAALLLESGDDDAMSRLLPAIASGDKVVTVALTSAQGSWRPDGVGVTAHAAADSTVLSGEASYVTHASLADVLLVLARTPDGPRIFEVEADAPGVDIRPLPTFDRTLRLDSVIFSDVPAGRIGSAGWDAMEDAMRYANVALAGEQVGGAGRIFELTVEYIKTRYQFGRPVGGFQAIKHMAADLFLELESAKSAARHAAARLAQRSDDSDEAIDLAAFTCGDAYTRIAASSIQMFGGIGFTWEHPAHLYLRRARSYSQMFGTAHYFRERFLGRLTAQSR